MDGSLSTLAPIFAVVLATHHPLTAFFTGAATALGAGVSMAFSEGLSDTGDLTGRGSPALRGAITGGGTFAGGIFHTLPFLIPGYGAAISAAIVVVATELLTLAWLRHKFFQTSFARSFVAVAVGGTIIASLSAGLGILAAGLTTHSRSTTRRTTMTTSLPTTRLGRTGMHLTRIGFGAWAIGGGDWAFAWGNQDDDSSVAAIRHAVESGINWIDTAAVYGLGHSEEVVAAALADLPEADRPYVFTKGGLVWDPADRSAAPRRAGAPASLRAEVEASLRRLRVERIDLYQMHWPAEDGTPLEEYWQVFTDLKREGKIRAAGLSNHGILQLEEAEEVGAVDAIQPPFNLIHRDAADDVLLWASEHEAGAIVYSPMASGLLTGSFTAERAARLQPGDWRAGHPDFTPPALSANLALADALRPVAERHDVTPAAVAVAWTLAFPGVTGAIVGARSPRQVDGWLPAATLELKEDDLSDIAAAIGATGAGTGPASPPLA